MWMASYTECVCVWGYFIHTKIERKFYLYLYFVCYNIKLKAVKVTMFSIKYLIQFIKISMRDEYISRISITRFILYTAKHQRALALYI